MFMLHLGQKDFLKKYIFWQYSSLKHEYIELSEKRALDTLRSGDQCTLSNRLIIELISLKSMQLNGRHISIRYSI